MPSWDGFFSAEVGASAALAGLIFVGFSVNLNKIISNRRLVDRGLQSIIVLVVSLVISSAYLVPGQGSFLFGVEILIISAVAWIINTRIDVISAKIVEKKYRVFNFLNIFSSQAALVPFIAGGIVSIFLGIAALYLLVAGILLCYVKAIVDSWILIVEINR